jgi:hypothetical protein
VEASKNEEKRHVVNSQHDGKLPGLPSLKDNEKQHECRKCKRGAMIETTHVGENATGLQYRICKNGGVGTAEPGMRILKVNIRGCDWRCKCNSVGWTTCQCWRYT